jgi:hypothetical protein
MSQFPSIQRAIESARNRNPADRSAKCVEPSTIRLRPNTTLITARLAVIAGVVACSISVARPVFAQQQFPYKAYINTDEVYVRSGPGQNYYPTDKLTIGQEVEVYRHDAGDWYAIKPVEGSFSWVADRYLRPTDDGLATVAEENVPARVGSRFSDIRDTIQVRLHRNETVELLESKPIDSAGVGKWYKIAPPPGEFRWVSGSHVDPGYARNESNKPKKNDDAAGDKLATSPSSEAKDSKEPHKRKKTPEEYQADLNDLELELSVMVVEEPTVWVFDMLLPRAESLVDDAETAVERGRARLLLNKIERFNDIKQRYDSVAALRERTERANRELSILSPRPRSSTQGSTADKQFDAVGKLTEVPSPKAGAPRYALVDGRGGVLCFVTPAPGVNLTAFLGNQVGITGTRGYMPEQRAQHVMARQVSVVDDRLLR